MAKSKPTPISEQAVCTQPTVYTFNFKEVPISKYAETLDILWQTAGLAKVMGVTLEEVAEENLAKLASRKQRNVIAGDGDER